MEMSEIALFGQLLAGLVLGLALGWSVRRVLRSDSQSGFTMTTDLRSPTLAFASGMVAIWLLHANMAHTLYTLVTYCVGTLVGLQASQRHPAHNAPWSVALLGALIFGTLCGAFTALVLSKIKAPLSEVPPAYRWSELVGGAGTFGLSIALTQCCALTGRWLTNLPTLLSVITVATYDVSTWLKVVRRGSVFFYADMATGFAYGIEQLCTGILVLFVWVALWIAGLIVAIRWQDRQAAIGNLALLGLMGFRWLA